nr:hypothetical protein [Bradyrhizobium sp.]
MKMMIAAFDIRLDHACITHRADQLPSNDRIAYVDKSAVRVQKLVRYAICVSDRDSTGRTFARVCHDAVDWGAQHRVLQIDSPLPIRADVVISVYALMG